MSSVEVIVPATDKFLSMVTSLPTNKSLSTPKSISIVAEPVTLKSLFIVVSASITNPKLGEISACAEPDLILSKSPSADAGTLNNPLPSPLINAPEISPIALTSPSIFVVTLISKVVPFSKDAVAEPSAILAISPVNAVVGILFNSEPSPLKEPLNEDAVTPFSTFKDVIISTEEVDILICSSPCTSIESKL